MTQKPGWQTSEFWVTVVVQIVGLLAAAGVFTTEQADQWQRVAEMAGGLIAMIISNIAYAQSRARVKSAESQKTPDCPPPNTNAGTANIAAVLGVLVASFFIISMLAGCAGMKPVAAMTPKEKATFFMSVYSDQAENYKTLVASPDLTDAQRDVMRTKKQIMTEVYPLIMLYSGYVDAGAVPDAAVETQIVDYLDRLARTVTQ